MLDSISSSTDSKKAQNTMEQSRKSIKFLQYLLRGENT